MLDAYNTTNFFKLKTGGSICRVTDPSSLSLYRSILTQSHTPLPTGRIYKLVHHLLYNSYGVDNIANSSNRERSVFAVEYNSHGNLLIAVSNNGSIIFYDCLHQEQIREHTRSHSAPINIIKFISEHLFLTGSDDCTCKLWDVRNMKSCISTLISHDCWVKNIELEEASGLILSSAFDDTIRAWTSIMGNPSSSTILTAQDLVRMKLSPTGSKLVFSLRSSPAMLCIVNAFNSATLGSDQSLVDFLTIEKNCELFVSLPDVNPEELPLSNSMQKYLELTSQKENSLQFILDYPLLDSQISRDYKVITYDMKLKDKHLCGSCSRYPYLYELATFYSLAFHPSGEYLLARQGSPDWPVRYTCIYQLSNNYPEEIITGEVTDTNSFYNVINKHKLVQIIPESTHRPDGIIREVCFSPEGNFILSPHEHGIRLYPFNYPRRTELDFDNSRVFNPQMLEDYITCTSHSEAVVTCKMSPTRVQIASGCLGGGVSFYSPKLV